MAQQRLRIKDQSPREFSVCAALFTVILLSGSPIALADDYLDSLHIEADKLEYLDETRSSNTVTTGKKNISPELHKALQSISEFEKYFRKTDSATVAIYFRLSTQERLRIYHRFKSSKDFNLAKQMTIDLYNQKR